MHLSNVHPDASNPIAWYRSTLAALAPLFKWHAYPHAIRMQAREIGHTR